MPSTAIHRLLGLVLLVGTAAPLGAQGLPAAGRIADEDWPLRQRSAVPASYEHPAEAGSQPASAERLTAPGQPSASPQSPRTAVVPPLPPRGQGSRGSPGSPAKVGGVSSLVTTGGGLALVLGLFFVVAWFLRRSSPRGSLLLPTEVVEVLGRTSLAPREQLHLLRLGNKLILVSAGAEGVRPLTEITDVDEVVRLAGICRQNHPQSSTAAFRQVLQQFEKASGRQAGLTELVGPDSLSGPDPRKRRHA